MWYLKSLYQGFVKVESDNSLDLVLISFVVILSFLQLHLVPELLALLLLLRLFVGKGKKLRQKSAVKKELLKEEARKKLLQRLGQLDLETLRRLVGQEKLEEAKGTLLEDQALDEEKLDILEKALKERSS